MKRSLIIAIIVAGVCIAGLQQASAKGKGFRGGVDGGCSYQGFGPGYQQLDDATKAKVDAFCLETKGLRKQIVMKKAEGRALMKSDTPDAKAVAEVAGELFELQSSLQEKARAAGVPMMMGPGRMGQFGGKGGPRPRQAPCVEQQGWN